MSDNWITIVPEDARFVPNESVRHRASDRFSEIAPQADEIEIKDSETVQFFDCGTNLERINCPSCNSEISIDWWQDCMNTDFDGEDGFKLAPYALPCCGKHHTLHDLAYDWPQGFARFAIDVMNPNIGKLEDKDKQEFEMILGTRLRVIYQHI
jgi:hypothetical protein